MVLISSFCLFSCSISHLSFFPRSPAYLICTSLNLSLKQSLEKDGAVNFLWVWVIPEAGVHTQSIYVLPGHTRPCTRLLFGGVLFVQSVRVSVCGCLSFYLNEGPCRCPWKLDLVKSQTEASVLTQSAGKGM